MADLLKILKEGQVPKPPTPAVDTAEQDESETAFLSPQMKQAQEGARRTRELLGTKGWCLWKCSILGGDIITVVRDENVEKVPGGYPVYTVAELEELCQDGVSDSTLRLVHEVKKLAGAKVTTEVAK